MRVVLSILLSSLVATHCLAWEPMFEEHPNSKLLKEMGFSIQFDPPQSSKSDPTWHYVWVSFDRDHPATRMILDQEVSVSLYEHQWDRVFESEHRLSMIDDTTGQMQRIKGRAIWPQKYGFRFFAVRPLLEKAQIRFYLYDKKADPTGQNSQNGLHIVYLKEFLPALPQQEPAAKPENPPVPADQSFPKNTP